VEEEKRKLGEKGGGLLALLGHKSHKNMLTARTTGRYTRLKIFKSGGSNSYN